MYGYGRPITLPLFTLMPYRHDAKFGVGACRRNARMSAPPPRLTAEQRATAAALRAAGCPDGLALDAACGRVAVADVEAWARAYRAELAAARTRGGMGAASGPGGAVLGVKAVPAEGDVVWVGRAGKKRVQRAGRPSAEAKEFPELWTRPNLAGWWRVPT